MTDITPVDFQQASYTYAIECYSVCNGNMAKNSEEQNWPRLLGTLTYEGVKLERGGRLV